MESKYNSVREISSSSTQTKPGQISAAPEPIAGCACWAISRSFRNKGATWYTTCLDIRLKGDIWLMNQRFCTILPAILAHLSCLTGVIAPLIRINCNNSQFVVARLVLQQTGGQCHRFSCCIHVWLQYLVPALVRLAPLLFTAMALYYLGNYGHWHDNSGGEMLQPCITPRRVSKIGASAWVSLMGCDTGWLEWLIRSNKKFNPCLLWNECCR